MQASSSSDVQAAGYPYASLGAAKAQAQRDAEERDRRKRVLLQASVNNALFLERPDGENGLLFTPDRAYRIVASADNAH